MVDDFDPALQDLSPRLWDVRYSELVAVVPPCREVASGFKIIRRHSKMRGVNSNNLHSLEYVPPTYRNETSVDLSVKLALTNIRSITNKTFLINDLISSHGLDFLFMTETWLNEGDRDSLAEASPCDFFFP